MGRRGPCTSIIDLALIIAGGLRHEILRSLALCEKDVTTLANDLALAKPSVSDELGVLRLHNLVEFRSDKKRHIYRLSTSVRAMVRDGFVTLEVGTDAGEHLSLVLHCNGAAPAGS